MKKGTFFLNLFFMLLAGVLCQKSSAMNKQDFVNAMSEAMEDPKTAQEMQKLYERMKSENRSQLGKETGEEAYQKDMNALWRSVTDRELMLRLKYLEKMEKLLEEKSPEDGKADLLGKLGEKSIEFTYKFGLVCASLCAFKYTLSSIPTLDKLWLTTLSSPAMWLTVGTTLWGFFSK